jgi:hypothetical protein
VWIRVDVEELFSTFGVASILDVLLSAVVYRSLDVRVGRENTLAGLRVPIVDGRFHAVAIDGPRHRDPQQVRHRGIEVLMAAQGRAPDA